MKPVFWNGKVGISSKIFVCVRKKKKKKVKILITSIIRFFATIIMEILMGATSIHFSRVPLNLSLYDRKQSLPLRLIFHMDSSRRIPHYMLI